MYPNASGHCVATSDTELMRRALEIACSALDVTGGQRLQWALGECGNDATLRAEVVSLLAADESPERALERSLEEPEIHDPWPGRLVGRYRIGQRIGSGGMGTVYRAEPESGLPLQPVALKLIKRGMDSDEILRRFLRERQILARLVHPHIARLLDGGMTVDGRPWFAMELVDGAPLLEYCDGRRLPVAARVDLMLQICDAVAYAHQNLVVHRDLKPGNVLVTGDGHVKLLDFGIAKLVDADGEAATRSMVGIMTPDYAAPEQYQRGLITTQTDVYLLGLLLAELLTGQRPAWPLRRDAEAGVEPARLDAAFAARAADGDADVVERAARRGAAPAALARALRGDLDRIARRAMAWQPERRYASVAALADDLRRHRRGEAVLAMGDSLRYRLGKFVRRHRGALAATAAVIAALALGMLSTLRETGRLRIAQAHTQTTLALLEDVFLGADPYTARGGDTRASDLLAGARERIEAEERLPAALAARLWFKLGIAHVSLDERAPAESALRAAVARSQEALACSGTGCVDVDAPATRAVAAAAAARLAHYRLVEDGDTTALPELEQAISQLRTAGAPARHDLAQALQFLADHEFNQGRYERLDALSAESVALERADAQGDVSRIIMALGIRASLLRASDRSETALVAASEAHRLALELGDRAPPGVRLYAEQQYAATLSAVGRAADAEPVLRAARDRAVELRGAGSGLANGLTWALADAQSELGKFDLAVVELRHLLDVSDDFKGANLAAVRNALGTSLLASGDAAGAAAELAAARAILCTDAAPSPPCLAILINLVEAELARGQLDLARRQLDALREPAGAAGNRAAMRWQLLESRWQLQRGDSAAAARALAQSRAVATEAPGPIDQARWSLQEAAIALASSDPAGALVAYEQAEQQFASRWTGMPPVRVELRASIERLRQ